MRKLFAAAAFAAALGTAMLASASAAVSGPRLTELGGARFPERAYILSLPSARKLTARDVSVSENGKPVSSVAVFPATALGSQQFALALVIDASNSMHGEPIERAMAAARVFAAKRKETQQFGVVAFNSESKVLVPFTSDRAAIAAALATTPPLAYYTRMYDAVMDTIELLRRERIHSASIVLLSDGKDVGSRFSLDAAVQGAKRAHVRIMTVGLRSAAFDPPTLKTLADQTGGFYTEAKTPRALSRIFGRLGTQLSNEYVVRYRSLSEPSKTVAVRASVAGLPGAGKSGYTTPALPKAPQPATAAPYRPSKWTEFWQSTAVALLMAALAAALVGLGIAVLLKTQQSSIRGRIAQFVSVAPAQADIAGQRVASTRVLHSAERSLRSTEWWSRISRDLEIAEVSIPAIHVVMGTAVATVFLAWLGWLLGGPGFALPALLVPLVVRTTIVQKLRRKRAKFLDQLPDNLQVLASALRAGHSLVGALSVVVDDAPEPSRSEFRRALADEQLGASLEDALTNVAKRMASRELEQVAMVSALGRDTGGNTAEVLDRLTDNIRDRFDLRRLISTLTAQGRMSRWVVSALPVGVLALISLLNPDYMSPMYHHTAGKVLLVFAGLMIIAGSLVIKRIVNIKV